MKKNVLISGAGGSVFPYLFNALGEKYNLVAMDSNPMVARLYPKKRIEIVPNVHAPEFDEQIFSLINKYNIDIYIPLIDEEIEKAIKISEKMNITPLCPNLSFVRKCLNKYSLMHELKEYEVSEIKTFMASEFDFSLEFPLILKPIYGRGSRGVIRVDNIDEYNAYFILEKYDKNDVLVQPYISGEEYTVSVAVNNKNKIMAIIPKIVYIKDGITKHAKTIKNKKIENACVEIVEKMLPHGPFNVQLKLLDNDIFIFEINPRFSTTIVLSIESGINEIDLLIKNINNINTNYYNNFEEIEMIRRWENVFLR